MMSDAWRAGLDGRLTQQLGFLLEADRLKSVVRGNRIADGSRRENTAEHSWHLALFADAVAHGWLRPAPEDGRQSGPRYRASSPARWSNRARMRRVARRSSCMTSQTPMRASTRPGSTGSSSGLRRPTPSWQ